MKKLLIILFLLFSSNIFADNITESRQFINSIGNAIVTFDDKKKLIDLMEESIDFQWISSRFSMDPQWIPRGIQESW